MMQRASKRVRPDIWRFDELPKPQPRALDSDLTKFRDAIAEKNAEKAWSIAKSFRQAPPRHLCTSFLQIIPSGAFTAYSWSPRAFKFSELMRASNFGLNSTEYACLINLASKTYKKPLVVQLWENAQKSNIKDIDLWNSYLAAVCDADSHLWPWTNTSEQSVGMDVEVVLSSMMEAGVHPNIRTLELVLASHARRGRLYERCEEILTAILASNDIQVSALTTIVECFAFNGEFSKGFHTALECAKASESNPSRTINPNNKRGIQYQLRSSSGAQFWFSCLRLCKTTRASNKTFDHIWSQMLQYKIKPTWGIYSMRIGFLENRNRFTEMYDTIPLILADLGEDGMNLASSALQRLVIGLANTGNPLLALQKLQDGNKLGVYIHRDVEPFLNSLGATREQLALFQEDDDEDTLF